MALEIVVIFASGFISLDNANAIYAMSIVASVIGLAAAVVMVVACYFGKQGGNVQFKRAFYCAIAAIVIELVMLILNAARVNIQALNIVFSVLDIAATIGFSSFIILACKEAVPSLKTLSIVTLVFYIVGLVLGAIGTMVSTASRDASSALSVFGGIFGLVGIILFVILIVKTRNRIGKEEPAKVE